MTALDKGHRVCLTPEAESDLESTWLHTAQLWSVDQADSYVEDLTAKFDLIAASPFIARERTEFSPPVRVHRHQSHVIIYKVSNEDIIVLRVAHMRQNWVSLLG